MNVENEVEYDNAPENNVGGVFWNYSCEGVKCQILGHLKRHKLTQEEGVKSSCDQCSGYQ